MDLFRNRYKIESTRLKNWEYSNPGYYFITICTYDRQNYFGKIKNQKMVFSKIGKITENCLIQIPNHFKNIKLDKFVVMPNHIHVIIRIMNNVETRQNDEHTSQKNVETRHGASLQYKYNKFGPLKTNSIPSIINHYKGSVTRQCRKQKIIYKLWQPRFYDRVIRNDQELNKIRNYIKKNIRNWKHDRNNPQPGS
ncbi:transposase [Patescibacteria group bacterium]|nr:transposase [Patescibacteria group bacterium]